ncbi:hypothetical protein [Pyrobaculum aerophilum]|uniref:Uncharacterized protein n=2 Tax=Pyrobaculum aerophilum TaxID=13773 RepID=Q8ZWS6_PYRAE|nr:MULTISPECIES: hypothetical protein [Pyrobaculum]AAL63623.1 hypothetical protein PAE1641 [Pyrobaculum aerophilum str. IM2]MCX8136463.1 hypothetical protein [Pyrobaculum aerophilum]HII46257.1 hypothetical protein [Pyrobaculum aerophilum]
MHRTLATVALFKFFIAAVIFSTTSAIDPVLLTSSLLMAISALILRIVEEGEVAFVLVGLILLIDIIGLLLSFTYATFKIILSYIFLIIWDIQILILFRQILQS